MAMQFFGVCLHRSRLTCPQGLASTNWWPVLLMLVCYCPTACTSNVPYTLGNLIGMQVWSIPLQQQHQMRHCQRPELQVPWGLMHQPLQQTEHMIWGSHLALQASIKLSSQGRSSQRSLPKNRQLRKTKRAVSYVRGLKQ